jgi:hypothetical protein
MMAEEFGELAHLHARDTSLVSIAPIEKIEAHRKRMARRFRGTRLPIARSIAISTTDKGELFGLSFFVRNDDRNIYRTTSLAARRRGARSGVEPARSHAARPAGGLGRHTAGAPPDEALQLVASPRRVRSTLTVDGGAPRRGQTRSDPEVSPQRLI